ncbi:helix-turn-helix domain-containing protein [Butyrivibrio sp. NC2007]|uniref:helix-turn-helix domain-containing protein n=1 Tax=Butyrivibrio sp. NC2007 TaxID=1280683 RepID=UPI0003B7966A|nr:helix-turn-helix domain-containing protein [Butyrivibrio sp. NC2007]
MNIEKRDKLNSLIKKAGYRNMRHFSEELGINEANLYSNLKGKWGMSINRMFKVANLLKCPIDTIIEIFYPEEYYKNSTLSQTD